MPKIPIEQLFKSGRNFKFKIPTPFEIQKNHQEIKTERLLIRDEYKKSLINPERFK